MELSEDEDLKKAFADEIGEDGSDSSDAEGRMNQRKIL